MAEEVQTEEKKEVKEGFLTKKNIIILAAMILLLTVVVIAAVVVISGKKDKEEEKPVSTEMVKAPPGAVFQFDPMVVNIARTKGTRYLKVRVGVEYAPTGLDVELNARKIQFEDILNTILSSRTIDQIADIRERDNIKRDIRDKFNRELSTEGAEIKNVFFSDFVVQ